MLQRLTIFVMLVVALLTFVPFRVLATNPASAGIMVGLNEAQSEAKLPNTPGTTLTSAAGNIIGYALAFVGIVFFLLSVYGGFLWMTARGNGDQAEKGKETIIACTIGAIIIAGSYALTDFVLTSVQKSAPAGNQTNSAVCASDSDCNGGEKCSLGNHQCISRGACIDDNDCLSSQSCQSGQCVDNGSPSIQQPGNFVPQTGPLNPSCTFNVCPAGYAFPQDCRFVGGVRVIWPQGEDPCDELTPEECSLHPYCK